MNDEIHEDRGAEDAEEVRTTTALEPAPPPAVHPSVTPEVQAIDLADRLALIEETRDRSMVEGVDYGIVPGTDKPALFKAGAEKLAVLFQLDIQPRSTKTWGPGDHLTVETQATVFHMVSGVRMGYGEGLCSTREKKYGLRKQDRNCPICGKQAIKRSKFPPRDDPDAPPGWYCYDKLGGCGSNFDDFYDERIHNQPTGEVENPYLPDTWNTVVKIAAKRARVDAALAVTGASALFTQDLDEAGDAAAGAADTLLAPAEEEQTARLNAALNWLLPPTEGERVWNEIKAQFGDTFYGQVVEAVVLPIRAAKQLRDDERATEREAGETDLPADPPPPDDDDQRPPEEKAEDAEAKS